MRFNHGVRDRENGIRPQNVAASSVAWRIAQTGEQVTKGVMPESSPARGFDSRYALRSLIVGEEH